MVESPCISVCVLDEDEMCQGCYRTLEEIGQWGNCDDAGKQRIVNKALERQAQESL